MAGKMTAWVIISKRGFIDETEGMSQMEISAPSFNGSPTCEIPVGLSGPI